MIKAVIIDDEPEAVRGLESLLKLFCPEVEVLGKADSVKKGIQEIIKLKPELVFLDIELKDGLGFDVLDQLPERKFATIFVTAFDHYAIKALRLNAMDYLLKPVDPDELIASVSRIKKDEFPDYSNLIAGNHTGKFTKIGVPSWNGTIYIELNSIIRMESSNNYTYIHCLDAKPLLVSKTLKLFEEMLQEENFVRCHHSHIVNIQYVMSYERGENAQLTLQDKTIVPVSRAKKLLIETALAKSYPSL